MNFFKRPHTLRRYSSPVYERGYSTIPYEDIVLPMDVQTMEDVSVTTPDGTKSVQQLKVFCDYEILVENDNIKQKADRLWFQGKWFDCISSRLSENTPLRHYTATFIQCLNQDQGTGGEESGKEETADEPGGS